MDFSEVMGHLPHRRPKQPTENSWPLILPRLIQSSRDVPSMHTSLSSTYVEYKLCSEAQLYEVATFMATSGFLRLPSLMPARVMQSWAVGGDVGEDVS